MKQLSSTSFAAIFRIYIKKVFCQKLKLKNNTTFFQPFIALHPALTQVNIQSAKKLVETYFNTFCLDTSITIKDKVKKVKALYRKWLYKDIEKVVEKTKLAIWQWQRCKAINQIVFGFIFYNAQIEAI